MNKEQYIRKVVRGIKVTDKVKKRIKDDLRTEFENEEEIGLTIDKIISQKGTPKDVADEFNQSYSDTKVQRQYRLQKSLKIAAIVLIFFAGLLLILSIFLSKDATIGIIGGADGPTRFILTPLGMSQLLTEIAGAVFFMVGCAFMLIYWIKRKKTI